MKNYHLSLYGILILFLGVMAVVVALSFKRPSNRYKLDPAQIHLIRNKR